MYESLLLATDGSEGAAGAVEAAIDIADRYGATLHVLYVVDTAVVPPYAEMGLLLEELDEEGHNLVTGIAADAQERGINTSCEVRRGPAARSIVEYADEFGVDLVVVGTLGRRGIGEHVLGCTAERVVRTASAPVLVVPSEE